MRKKHETKTAASSTTWPESSITWTWNETARRALEQLGGTASLKALYEAIEGHEKTKGKAHWRARLRETLQSRSDFCRVGPGIWSLSKLHSEEDVREYERVRRKQHPLLGPRTKS
ncbi:MAG: hypothetical protein JO195_05515 [Candidatus Eremiobacteraeota bacterium]|nr:hypothetical protein [Candidatus Eremiobacteraeota bacterium]